MFVSEYVKTTTAGDRITFRYVLMEFFEFLEAICERNKKHIWEEWEDTLHFIQLWLYWRFGLNQELWRCTSNSVKKFMDRVEVWNKIYEFVGLKRGISGFAGNYNRKEKVVNQLARFGVSREKAEEAFQQFCRAAGN